MLHSIKSLTTELKAVHLNLVILICIWMSCISVPLVCARGKDVWWIRCSFPGCAQSRGRQAARPPRESRQEKPWKSPGMPALSPSWPCSAGWEQAEIRWGWPISALPGWKWAYTRELWDFLVVVVVTETSPVHLPINTAPISVYITHSASSLADWGVNDSGLFVC